ncbi:DegT/DnrJ/EryC1/StrS aminotransferase family protein [Patescibacteria group bacterium]|nr:DegT/DnrJ/EryC1/StrS aminotransferase family protein [Patescibacteria group bacterium]
MKKIPVSEPNIGKTEMRLVASAVKSGMVSSAGPFVAKFEQQFAGYCGRRFGAAVTNGTAALHLALAALETGAGDEVIVPDLTFVSVANAVRYSGARPVFADVEPETFNLDPAKIDAAVTERTKAVIVPHLYGHPADMDKIMEAAGRRGLAVIEDAAEAHGARYKGKPCGSFGAISCFSFYGNKLITTGEGGMCLTDDPKLNERIRLLRDHGMDANRKYWHSVIGFNYRMTNLQAALGLAQLGRIDKLLLIKRKNAALYKEFLQNVPWLALPAEKPYAESSYWMFTVFLKDNAPVKRDELVALLAKHGIDTRVAFYPITDLPPYRDYKGSWPVAKDFSYRGITLPSSTKLSSYDIKYISRVIRSL